MKKQTANLNEELNRISELMKPSNVETKPVLNETSLSRVWRHTEDYDCAIISASRNENTPEENKKLNSELRAYLLNDLNYGVTKIQGSYIENFETPEAVEVSEDSVFVANINGDANFVKNIKELGAKLNQDSVLIKEVGQDAKLVGTKEGASPDKDEEMSIGKFIGGKEDTFMSRVGKGHRPFVFGEGLTSKKDLGWSGRYGASIYAKNFKARFK